MSQSTIYIKKLVLIAVLGASLNVIKFCFMYIPNVEAVTLLVTVYTYCFGIGVGLPATLVFCALEGLIFGFDPSWLVAYFIHWPFVSLVAYLLKILKVKNPILISLVIGAVTALFGLQSTFVYFLVGGAIGKEGWVERYWITYASGWLFYVVQTVVNIVLIAVAFKPLIKVGEKLKEKYFG